MNNKMYWYTSSYGLVEFSLTLKDAQKGSHSGDCDDDISELLQVPYIKAIFDKIDPEAIQKELQEIFFDSGYDPECNDVENNKKRMLWIACGDIVDNMDE